VKISLKNASVIVKNRVTLFMACGVVIPRNWRKLEFNGERERERDHETIKTKAVFWPRLLFPELSQVVAYSAAQCTE